MQFIPRQLTSGLKSATKTFPALLVAGPKRTRPLLRRTKSIKGYDVRRFVVHRPSSGPRRLATLRPGVKALSADRLANLWQA